MVNIVKSRELLDLAKKNPESVKPYIDKANEILQRFNSFIRAKQLHVYNIRVNGKKLFSFHLPIIITNKDRQQFFNF